MAADKSTPRSRALHHLYQAAESGIRGPNLDAVKVAIAQLEGSRAPELSNLHYDRLKPGEELVDPQRPGLILRALKSGKYWIYRFSALDGSGKQPELRLGSYPLVSIAEARTVWEPLRAARLRGEVPRLDEKDSPATLTMRDLCRRFVAEYSEKVKRSWRDDERILNREVLPDYGDTDARAFGSAQVSEILLRIKKRGSDREAEKVRAVLSALFNVASGRTRKIEFLKGTWLPASHPNPCAGVNLAERAAAPYAHKDATLAAFLRGLGEAPIRTDMKDLILLQAQTCSRIGEVAGMRWDELDGNTWVLPASRAKNGEAHRVMLSAQSQALLARRNAIAAVSPFVFPSQKDAHRATRADLASSAFSEARDHLKLPREWTSHKVRHACLTWLAENRYGREVRDRVSNHKPSGIDSIYNRSELNEPAREALQAWCDHLDALAVPNVLPLERCS